MSTSFFLYNWIKYESMITNYGDQILPFLNVH